MKKIGIYIHIPFCKQKCYYCDFISFAQKEELQERYVRAIIREIENFLRENQNLEIATIYIGGGTPSYLDSKYIKKILRLFHDFHPEEVTIEVNPGTANREKLETYKKAGVNRLSIGLQSSENRLLKNIGRIHNFEDFLTTYHLAKEIGFSNINVDCMIGLPEQSIADIKNTLEKVVRLEPKHISVYSLIVEENTKIAQMLEKGEIKLPEEEEERNMYWYVKNFLELQGYYHYEISNFAKKGYESRHNLACWEQKEYVGFGLAAHSYMDKIRYSNTEDLENYIQNCEERNFKKNKILQEKQNDFMQEQEYMMLGLRKIDGIAIQSFKNKFGENPIFVFRKELSQLVEEGLVVVTENHIKLTYQGLDFANLVWEEFV